MNREKALSKFKDLELEMSKLKIIIEQPEDLFSKINNYSDVCKELNEQELTEKNYSFIKNKKDRLKQLAFGKLKQIERLFNGDWIAIFNGSQQNWYPYFTPAGGSLVFCFSSYFSDYCGGVGFFKDRKTSDFVGKGFIDIYRELI